MIIGAQLYTVRSSCKTTEDLDSTLRRCAEMGFAAVQLSGVCDYDPCWMKQRLDEYGLIAPITHSKADRILNDTEKLIEDHKIIGAEYVGLGSVPNFRNCGCDEEYFVKYMDSLGEAIEKIGNAGLKFMYHNHNMEFARMSDGKLFIEYVSELFAGKRAGITLDCYWVTAGGGDPAQWLRRLSGQVDCIHLKDMVYWGPDKATRMAPVGYGNLNHAEIVKAAADAGVKYAFIEQDSCYEEDTFDALKKSLDSLRKLGCKE